MQNDYTTIAIENPTSAVTKIKKLAGMENENVRRSYPLGGIENVKIENIPQELKELRQWVAWTGEDKGPDMKAGKMPINPHTGGNAQSNNPSTWGTLEQAVNRATKHGLLGVGLMFSPDDTIVGVDLDNCWDMQKGWFKSRISQAIISKLNSYAEISPSGGGVKLWVRGLPGSRLTCGKTKTVYQGETLEYEVYQGVRFFTVTGQVLPKFHTALIHERDDVVRQLIALGRPERKPRPTKVRTTDLPLSPATGDIQDEEDMLRAALRHLDVDSESTWFRMGCCLMNWGKTAGDDRAKALWDEWSKGSDKFDPATQDERWDRMEPDRGLTIGTVFSEAEYEGYEYGDAIGADDRQYHVDRASELGTLFEQWHAEYQAEMAVIRAKMASQVKPVIELPNIGGWSRMTISEAGEKIGDLMGNSKTVYCRGGVVVKIKEGESVEVTPAEMQSELERHASLTIAKANPKGEVRTVATTATASQCQAVMASQSYLDRIPQIKTMTRCPVITARKDGTLAVVTGYDRESGILATGGAADDVTLADATTHLRGCLADFEFSSKGDESRAIASLITPALVQGGLLGGRAPIDLGEADDSQAGKGYRNRMVASIYNAEVNTIAQRQGGSGSLEESFCRALMAGASFLSIDNVRRKIDSPMIESALTEDYCDCRVPYRQPMQIDMRRVCVMMTTNGVELNRDLANRCSPVRIRKHGPGYAYRNYPEGDLIAHVKANQGRFLGAIFAVVKAWHAAGRPATGETRHDFRRWAGVLDWIVQNIFHAAPLCDRLLESKARMTNPHLSWIRELGIAVLRKGLAGRPLRAVALVDIAEEAGIDLGGDPSTAPEPDKAANQMMGKRLGRAFSSSHDGRLLYVDDTMMVERQEEPDAEGRPRKSYVFSQGQKPPENDLKRGFPPDQASLGGTSGGKSPACETGEKSLFITGCENRFPPDSPPDRPLINPLITPNVPLIPLMSDDIFSTMAAPASESDGFVTQNSVCDSIGEKSAFIRGSGGICGGKEAPIIEHDSLSDRFLSEDDDAPTVVIPDTPAVTADSTASSTIQASGTVSSGVALPPCKKDEPAESSPDAAETRRDEAFNPWDYKWTELEARK